MGRKYSAQQMIDAILEAEGNLSQAARILGCSRQTVHRYVNDYSTVKDAYDEALERKIDHVESKLHDLIDKGHPSSIKYYLSTKAKHRGYVERQERSIDGEFTVNVKYEESSVSLPEKPPPKTGPNTGE